MTRPNYIGRFAPSPTGPLHAGSLIAAAASYLRARQHGGQWLVRIEDIDPPREIEGAADDILRTLEHFGFEWDQKIIYQSHHTELYRHALDTLKTQHHAYPCVCSRRELRQHLAESGGTEGVYPGICRPDAAQESSVERSSNTVNWRANTGTGTTEFIDLLQGTQRVKWQVDQGDFVIWRKDDLPSYQLAVTVDDHDQRISEVVRGKDLLQETAGQNLLRAWLGFAQITTLHIPLMINSTGQKLSKQTGAAALDKSKAPQQLCTALSALGLNPDAALNTATPHEIWRWAIANWDLSLLNNIDKIAL